MTNSVKGCGSPDKCSRSDEQKSQRSSGANSVESAKAATSKAATISAECAGMKAKNSLEAATG